MPGIACFTRAVPRSRVVDNASIGRAVRSGPIEEAGIPTDRLAIGALAAGDVAEAEQLVRHVAREAESSLVSYSQWIDGLLEHAAAVLPGFAARRAALEARCGPFVPTAPGDGLAARPIADALAAVAARDERALRAALDAARPIYRARNDAYSDWAWGVLTELRTALGEAELERAFRASMQGWRSERYAALGRLTQREIFELALESTRPLLGGPAGEGDVDVAEDDEKWVLSFDPCGTGGRMRRAGRAGAPFGFADVEGAYDWTWGERGVCLFCAHCSFVNEIVPIEQHGAPMRVTEYPDAPGKPCTWTIYKAPELVPDRAFERVGKRRGGQPSRGAS